MLLTPTYFLPFILQLKDLLVRTIEAWVNLFDPENKEHLPILKMELTFDDEKMQFYPPYEDLEETVIHVMTAITKTLQQVPTVQSWLSGGNTVTYTDASIADHILKQAHKTLIEAVKRNFEEPSAHLDSFSMY